MNIARLTKRKEHEARIMRLACDAWTIVAAVSNGENINEATLKLQADRWIQDWDDIEG